MMTIWDLEITLSKATLILLMILTFTGCEVPDRREIPMPEKPYTLKHDSRILILYFQGHRSKLSEDEESRLLSALKPTGPGKASTHVTIPNKGTRLEKQRLKNIVRTLLNAGIKAKQIHRSDAMPCGTKNAIEIMLDTYRAIPPSCPNWSTTYGPGYNRGRTSNFGCSTAVNFLLMIDDPIVLFKGESALSRDAARDSLAISDYRAGKDKGKWLKVDKADSSSSSGPGGSSSSGGASQ